MDSSKFFGYHGRVLEVNLSHWSIEVKPLEP